MISVDECSTLKEILLFVRGLRRNEVSAISTILNNSYDYSLPSYATKKDMIREMKEVQKEHLLEAVEKVVRFDEDDEDDFDEEEEFEEEDDDSEKTDDSEDEDEEEGDEENDDEDEYL